MQLFIKILYFNVFLIYVNSGALLDIKTFSLLQSIVTVTVI